jgi:formylglycine-generating enzyme required for sulfatase activity
MSGNVSELCWDWYNNSYGTAAATDPRGPTSGAFRVIRGGGWGSGAPGCRSANRSFTDMFGGGSAVDRADRIRTLPTGES